MQWQAPCLCGVHASRWPCVRAAQVYCRLHPGPPGGTEPLADLRVAGSCTVHLLEPGVEGGSGGDTAGQQAFTFDGAFTGGATQQECFEAAAGPVLEAVQRGYNGTIMAYGQTSSGARSLLRSNGGARRVR